MAETLTLGSLFDGSGGFPLGGIINRIKPVWASEIEPFPIMVTTKRLPFMEHIGNISSVRGGEITPVDIITFGSPCQDMSIAGRRDGLSGSRSGLFYEAVRIVKEMREATDGRYPGYIVWENVTGAFSSNKGEDFRAVLEEIVRIREAEADIPRYEKWPSAGQIVADHISVAWRVFDAQYWGVPQRRKRIYLVADLDGERAGKILFESEGMSGYSAEGFRTWQRASGNAEGGTGKTGCLCLNDQGGQRIDVTEDCTYTPSAQANHPPCIEFDNHSQDCRTYAIRLDNASAFPLAGKDLSPNIRTGAGPNGTANVVVALNCRNGHIDEEISGTLQAKSTGGHSLNYINPVFSSSKASFFTDAAEEVANTLVATDYKDPPLVNQPEYIVRRLTPTECARLQGFPDWWTDGLGNDDPTEEDISRWAGVFETYRKATGANSKPKTESRIRRWLKDPYSDSAAYKLWGNGVALPCVCFVLAGIVWVDQKYTKTGA